MMRRLAIACVLLAPALALAEPKTAGEWYSEGETQFSLGNFQGAIDAFKKGFAMEPVERNKAAYLYNIAQAYRLSKMDCGQARFFYNRYLDLKSQDTVKPLTPEKRAEVEGFIKDLEACESVAKKQPDGPMQPDGPGAKPDGTKPGTKDVATKNGDGDGDGDGDDGGKVVKGATGAPKLISARLLGGGAVYSAGELPVPTQASGALIAGYPLALSPQLGLELGAAFTFSPMPFEGAMGQSQSGQFIGAMANLGATYNVIPKLGVRADVGAGVLVMSGISESPFTAFQPTTGALSVFHVRAGVSADYAITPNVVVTAAPFAFSYSPAATGFAEKIKSITTIDFMVGLGYRM
ncbi:MAG: tetratricopeptide repeat protein [Deltaproteobacteria bacterium]|nr:tetratricopeptide repeat protein [Deltaproteobacteria bacterium]MCW5800978.1 tetratricopeptide repeat protein [Deltaproteobacteria bacterium]